MRCARGASARAPKCSRKLGQRYLWMKQNKESISNGIKWSRGQMTTVDTALLETLSFFRILWQIALSILNVLFLVGPHGHSVLSSHFTYCKQRNRQMQRQTQRQTDGRRGRWMEGTIDRKEDRQMDGWMVTRSDDRIDR